MATIVDYQYIPEVSTLDALHNLASDTTNGYSQELPGVNTFLINGANQITNIPEGGKGIAGWSTNVSWSSSAYDSISWSNGKIYLPDGTEIDITAGSASLSATTYIYVDQEDGTVYYTTTASDSVGENKILLCVASPTASGKSCAFQAFGNGDQSTFITASNIAANTITANEIASNTITANEIKSGAITTSKLDAGAVTTNKIAVNAVGTNEIDDGAVTADKIYVNTLGAITANLGDVHVGATSGTGTGIRIYPASSTSGRIDFYYNGSVVGYASGLYNSTVGGGVTVINGTNAVVIDGDMYNFKKVDFSQAKLRIPVGTNLY